jgi:hypothetical protein
LIDELLNKTCYSYVKLTVACGSLNKDHERLQEITAAIKFLVSKGSVLKKMVVAFANDVDALEFLEKISGELLVEQQEVQTVYYFYKTEP